MPDQAATGQVPVNIATPWHDGGFSVIPIKPDGTKRPAVKWADFMTTRMTNQQVEGWWAGGSDYGVAVICGAVSGNVEMLELEAAATDAESLFAIQQQCRLLGIEHLWDELSLRGYAEMTPTGGLHMIYRISDHEVPGNEKVAQAADLKTLAETRGTGGYSIVAPTDGRCHHTGEPWVTVSGIQGEVMEITWAQRCGIHAAIRLALDKTPERLPAPRYDPPVVSLSEELRPGDDFNARASWVEILEPHGWQVFRHQGSTTYWTRPGKNPRDGHSATTGRSATGDRMYVFSSSAGLPVEEPMTKLWVYAHYNHGGQLIPAVRTLASLGYGALRDKVNYDDWSTGPAPAPSPVRTGVIQEVESPGKVPLPLFDGTETDVGSARRFEKKAAGKFAYDHVGKQWMMFKDGCWVHNNTESIMMLAWTVGEDVVAEGEEMLTQATTAAERQAARRHRAWGMQLQTDGKLRSMLRQYACMPSAAFEPAMMDQAQGALNMSNGFMELETQQVGPNEPEHRMTMQFGAPLDREATAPKFERFMEQAFPDSEVRAYVQRAFGYALTGTSNERTFFMLHGPSGTGKSTLLNLMVRMFGDYGHTANETVFKQTQNDSSVSLHELRKKRLVATSELPRDASLNENLLKRITGGDPINSRTLYQREQVWQPECVIFVATNFLPRISGDDDALWRRAKVIEMNTPFIGAGEVRDMSGQLFREEKAGIFNWLLAGLASYQQIGLAEPDSMRSATEKYRHDADPIATFLTEQIDEGVLVAAPAEMVPVGTVYELYRAYAHTNGQGQCSKQRISARLKVLGHESFKQSGRQMYRGLGLRIQTDQFMLRS